MFILHPSLQTSLSDLFGPRALLVSVILRDKGVDAERWHLSVVSSTALFVS